MTNKKTLPPTYFFVIIILQVLIHFAFPFLWLLIFPVNLIGVIFIAAGAALNIFADKAMKEANTTVKPFEESSHLLTQGAFKISRRSTPGFDITSSSKNTLADFSTKH